MMARSAILPDISERVLGHAIAGIEGVYYRYCYEGECARAIQSLWQTGWAKGLVAYQGDVKTLTANYARNREMERIPIQLADGTEIRLSPGEHSALIRDNIAEFAPRFAPGSVLIYAGDTGEKMGYFDRERLAAFGVSVDHHGKMPDVVIHDVKRNWLLLIASVNSHGPVEGKRHHELAALFAGSTAGLVFVTTFPIRAVVCGLGPELLWHQILKRDDRHVHHSTNQLICK